MKNKKIRIGFMGSPVFASYSLKKIILTKEIETVCVWSRKPAMKNRGQKIISTPVEIEAKKNNIEVRTPEKLDFKEEKYIESLNLDLLVVVAYGLLLPKIIIDLPERGTINAHASILPVLRGASPIERAIEEQHEKTGVTIMQMEKKLDAGDVLRVKEIKLSKNTERKELHDVLMKISADLLIEEIKCPSKKKKQNDKLATYAKKISKNELFLDWNNNAKNIHAKVNAFEKLNIINSNIKILKTKIFEKDELKENNLKSSIEYKKITSGAIVNLKPFVVKTKDSLIEVLEIQKPGKKIMSAQDFLNGSDLKIGDYFGSKKI